MKKISSCFFVLIAVPISLSFLLFSCGKTTVVPDERKSDVVWGKKDYFEISKNVFEGINDIVYADYLNTDEGKIGARRAYILETKDGLIVDRAYVNAKETEGKAPLILANIDGSKIALNDEQTEGLEMAIRRSGYGFDAIYVTKERISYCFGLACRQYIYTFDGNPPTYYLDEDREEYFHVESLGGNWHYASMGG